MITVKGKPYPWFEGMTVEKLMNNLVKEDQAIQILGVTAGVSLNKQFIRPKDYQTTKINDEDEIIIIVQMAGG